MLRAAVTAAHKAGVPIQAIQDTFHLGQDKLESILKGSGSIDDKTLQEVMDAMGREMAGIVVKMLARANNDEFLDALAKRGFHNILGIATLLDKIEKLRGKPDQIIETKSAAEDTFKVLADIRRRREELNRARLEQAGQEIGPETNS